MQAVILAGGVGKRLRPLTDDIPKPMVRVNGVPILEYTLSILPKEIDEAILVVGYKKEKIIEYFGDRYGDIKLRYVVQDNPNGTGHALELARPFLKDGLFILLYGDDLYHPDDLEDLVKAAKPAVLVKEIDAPEKFGTCIVDEDGHLVELLEKDPNSPSNLTIIGAHIFDHTLFDVPKAYYGTEHNLSLQIGEWAKVCKIKVRGARFWHPIGYPEDVELGHELLEIPPEERLN